MVGYSFLSIWTFKPQIKLKFGMARVYLNGLPYKCSEIAEDAINEIMKCEL